jgi:hypothetical protein
MVDVIMLPQIEAAIGFMTSYPISDVGGGEHHLTAAGPRGEAKKNRLTMLIPIR